MFTQISGGSSCSGGKGNTSNISHIAKGTHKLYVHRFAYILSHIIPWHISVLYSLHIHQMIINCWAKDLDLTWQCRFQCACRTVFVNWLFLAIITCIGPVGALGWFVLASLIGPTLDWLQFLQETLRFDWLTTSHMQFNISIPRNMIEFLSLLLLLFTVSKSSD